MKTSNFSTNHPLARTRGWVAGTSAQGQVELSGLSLTTISPAQLTANTDNWLPTGLETASVIRASTDASRNLTGIVAPSSSKLLLIENVGANDLVLIHNSTSTAANRFFCPKDIDLPLAKDAAALLEYDMTSARWRVVAASGASTAALSPLTTKGDLWGFSTVNTRVPVGADGLALVADSSQSLGVKWGTISNATTFPFHDESLTDGASNFIFAGGDIVTVVGVPNP